MQTAKLGTLSALGGINQILECEPLLTVSLCPCVFFEPRMKINERYPGLTRKHEETTL